MNETRENKIVLNDEVIEIMILEANIDSDVVLSDAVINDMLGIELL